MGRGVLENKTHDPTFRQNSEFGSMLGQILGRLNEVVKIYNNELYDILQTDRCLDTVGHFNKYLNKLIRNN